jgi:hypothetical protein
MQFVFLCCCEIGSRDEPNSRINIDNSVLVPPKNDLVSLECGKFERQLQNS